jgi:protein TonB
MFESLALEDPRNTRRRWTTAASFVLEALAVGVLILAPLGYTEAISLKIGEPIIAPTGSIRVETRTQQPPTPHQHTRPLVVSSHGLEYTGFQKHASMEPDPGPPIPTGDDFNSVAYSTGPIGPNSAMDRILAVHKAGPTGPSVNTRATTVKISRLDPGMLIKQVQPIYPKIALISHTEGTVLLAAVIDTQGRITQLRALRGHPLLIPAALDAVQQWRYKPYILNGAAVEVETQVSVVFTLQR